MCDVCGRSSSVNIGLTNKVTGSVDYTVCSDCLANILEKAKEEKTHSIDICTCCGEVKDGVDITLINGVIIHCCVDCLAKANTKFTKSVEEYMTTYREIVVGYLDAETKKEQDKYLSMLPIPKADEKVRTRYLNFCLEVGAINGLFKQSETLSGYTWADIDKEEQIEYKLDDLLRRHPTAYDFWLTSSLFSRLDSIHIESLKEYIAREIQDEVTLGVEQLYLDMTEKEVLRKYPEAYNHIACLAAYKVLLREYGFYKVLFDTIVKGGVSQTGIELTDHLGTVGVPLDIAAEAMETHGFVESALEYLHNTILKHTDSKDYQLFTTVVGEEVTDDIEVIKKAVGQLITTMEKEKLLVQRIQDKNLKGFYALALKYFYCREKLGDYYLNDPLYNTFIVAEQMDNLTKEIREELTQTFEMAGVARKELISKYAPLDKNSWVLKLLSPRSINEKLGEYIIGQDKAKKIVSVGVYNHMKRLYMGLDGRKSNIMLIGATGVGKTEIVRAVATILDVPVVTCDATSMTQAGYQGQDVESCIAKLLTACKGDVKQAERGIVYIDEIDKIARTAGEKGVSSECVQQSLLKIIEGCDVELMLGTSPMDKHSVTVNTNNILFICGGAFEGLTMKKEKPKLLGFNSVEQPVEQKRITQEDLTKFGMLPEFVGRFAVLAELHELEVEDLKRILTEPKNSIIKEYTALIEADGVTLEVTDKALTYIAEQAKEKGTGARGLKSVLEDYMLDMMYELPSQEAVDTVTIDANAQGLVSKSL